MADRHLTRADAEWRGRPFTEDQLSFLRWSDPTIGAAARAERWDQGRVSDAINALITDQRLRCHAVDVLNAQEADDRALRRTVEVAS